MLPRIDHPRGPHRRAPIPTVEGPYKYGVTRIQNLTFQGFAVETLPERSPPVPGSCFCLHSLEGPSETFVSFRLLASFDILSPSSSLSFPSSWFWHHGQDFSSESSVGEFD